MLVRVGQLIFKWRDLLFSVVLVGIGLGTRPRLTGGSTSVDHLVDAIGLGVSLCGQVVRGLVIGLVYITRGGQNREIWANTLVEEGIFAHCRNPLYVGNVLIIAGLTIVHGGWAMYFVVLPFFLFAYSAVVRAEERYLRDRFGESYTVYRMRVPRWWPRLRGLRATLHAGRFDWLRVVRKEYGTPFAWLSGAAMLLLVEHRGPGAAPLRSREGLALATIWCGLATAYLIARTLKLRGQLGQD